MLRRIGGSLLVALAVLAVISTGARAATITVSTEHDDVPGSLRSAIEKAESGPGDVVVVPAGRYVLNSELSILFGRMTIVGAGASTTTIEAGGPFRVLDLFEANVTIRGVTIRHGSVESNRAFGGGIDSLLSELQLEEVVVEENEANANEAETFTVGGQAYGGGIYSEEGALTLKDSAVSGNKALADGGSGAAGGLAVSGGIWSNGELRLQGVSIAHNLAQADGGQGPSNPDQVARFASAGGLTEEARSLGEISINGLTLAGNAAEAIAGPGGGATGEARQGGAYMYGYDTPILIANATVVSNTARSNELVEAGGMGLGEEGSVLTLESSTLSENALETTDASKDEGGGNLEASPGVHVLDTIVNNGFGPASSSNCLAFVGGLTSLGHNLDSTDQCNFDAAGDQVNANPQLGALHDNGGPLETQALAPSSPAIGAGENCPATDARGVPRPASGCDIGAFELAPATVQSAAASALTSSSATLNASAANPSVLAGSVYFQWGTSTAYGEQTLPQGLGPTLASTAFSASLTGLSPATSYHFRAVAVTPEGTTYGADESFTTASAPVASVAPVLSNLQITPAKLRAEQGTGASIASVHRKQKAKPGASVSYRDSEAARSTFTVLGLRPGFRVGSRCLAIVPRHHKGKLRTCIRDVSMGSFSRADSAGANRFQFTGRAASHALAPGRYLLRAVARNAAGQSSRPLSVPFRVLG